MSHTNHWWDTSQNDYHPLTVIVLYINHTTILRRTQILHKSLKSYKHDAFFMTEISSTLLQWHLLHACVYTHINMWHACEHISSYSCYTVSTNGITTLAYYKVPTSIYHHYKCVPTVYPSTIVSYTVTSHCTHDDNTHSDTVWKYTFKELLFV